MRTGSGIIPGNFWQLADLFWAILEKYFPEIFWAPRPLDLYESRLHTTCTVVHRVNGMKRLVSKHVRKQLEEEIGKQIAQPLNLAKLALLEPIPLYYPFICEKVVLLNII